MLISKQWLKTFVKLPKGMSNQKLAELITLRSVEVEEVIDQAAALGGVVVGLITQVGAHPNADKLKLCQVDVGGRQTQIVCGGANVAQGMKVAVALPGALVRWHGEGDLIELKMAKIRGEESEGMICASAEIGLPQTEGDDDIRDLSDLKAKPGTALSKALGINDIVFDIEHKSLTNRPDLMGHYGMAREVGALVGSDVAAYKPAKIPFGKGFDLRVNVKDQDACPRYMVVAVDGVVVGSSPAWLVNRLEAAGVRSINTVVDVTNYVMLETGQPMHAFDAKVLGKNIEVRTAKKGETIMTLDGVERSVEKDTLLITDGKKPVAIAGVMGGEGSGVSESTTTIIFESANFDPVSVRKTSTKLSLRSESSSRFEKSLDATLCPQALARAVELLSELSPGSRVISNIVDVQAPTSKPTVVSLAVETLNTRLGVKIPEKEVVAILERLGFIISSKAGTLAVTIPSWRATKDVQIAEDVIEEVARLWGYDKIDSAMPMFTMESPYRDPVRTLSRRLRQQLSLGQGVHEVYQYAFVSPDTLTTMGLALEDHLKLANPLAEDRPYLVRSLLPNLLEVVASNHREYERVSLYEIARVFVGEHQGEEDGQKSHVPDQPYQLALVYTQAGDDVPFVELKRQVASALRKVGFSPVFKAIEVLAPWMHETRSADVFIDGESCGVLAEVRPTVVQALGINRRVAVAEIDVSRLAGARVQEAMFSPLAQFPSVKRDVAFVIAERTVAADIEGAARNVSELLEGFSLFDVYRGKGVEDGHKSIAVHLSFRSANKTLEASEVDDVLGQICKVLEKEFGATIRS